MALNSVITVRAYCFLPDDNGSRQPLPPVPNCNDGLESPKGQQVNIV